MSEHDDVLSPLQQHSVSLEAKCAENDLYSQEEIGPDRIMSTTQELSGESSKTENVVPSFGENGSSSIPLYDPYYPRERSNSAFTEEGDAVNAFDLNQITNFIPTNASDALVTVLVIVILTISSLSTLNIDSEFKCGHFPCFYF